MKVQCANCGHQTDIKELPPVVRLDTDAVKAYVEHTYGKRCKTKDTHDFPELKDDPLANRCPICEAWDAFDKYFEGKNA